ncbi:unnamed protein product [Amoebophrya sp. A25]|nr:unnamed protein product [Amoebophrya sp. A25]|eukprot:GSA25T00010550001.1
MVSHVEFLLPCRNIVKLKLISLCCLFHVIFFFSGLFAGPRTLSANKSLMLTTQIDITTRTEAWGRWGSFRS